MNFQVLKIMMSGNHVVWKKEEFLKNSKLMKIMEQTIGLILELISKIQKTRW